MVLKRLHSYFQNKSQDKQLLCCMGKLPFDPEFIRFQTGTIEAQHFSSWLDGLYKIFLLQLSLLNQNWDTVFPLQFVWKKARDEFVWGSILSSQDSKEREYPLGIARWSDHAFSMSFYEQLADLDLKKFKNQGGFEQALCVFELLEGGDSHSLLMKGVQAEQPLFYQLIGIFKSWVLRFESMPQYKGVEIPLPKNVSSRTRLSLIRFWIQLTERLVFTRQWQHVYWHRERLLISFIPLSQKAVVSWILQPRQSGQWVFLSDKIAVDVVVQKALQRQLRDPIYSLDGLLARLSES